MAYKREYISKATRIEVWNKFNKHCAYCGCELEYKDMQVDHFIPFRKGKTNIDNREDIQDKSNYFPACRSCNYYKRARGLESMRKDIANLYKQLEKNFDYRLAKKYNLIEETPRKIEFYFEWFDEQTKEKI